FAHHEFHDRVGVWMRSQQFPPLATCAITELGFIRVLVQAPAYGFTVHQARTLLLRIKQAAKPHFSFVADDQDISRLPAWVKTARQTTDGHLVQLASSNGAVLATLDSKIPGAYFIPE
ncbi:MAG: hypothetical protein WBD45_25280, partial [Terriglobales bacterium]